MTVLTISGSNRSESSNQRLLKAIAHLFPEVDIQHFNQLNELPLFEPNKDVVPWPESVLTFRKAAKVADAIIISTPAYIYNMPALLKNALEWVTSSGELMRKRVLAITYTPNEPRGKEVMQSLLWSLTALEANVVASMELHQNELKVSGNGDALTLSEGMEKEMLLEGVLLLLSR